MMRNAIKCTCVLVRYYSAAMFIMVCIKILQCFNKDDNLTVLTIMYKNWVIVSNIFICYEHLFMCGQSVSILGNCIAFFLANI